MAGHRLLLLTGFWITVLIFTGIEAHGASTAADLVRIPGGMFIMGDAEGEPDEKPRRVRVKSFRLMRFEVTNQEFAAFVAADQPCHRS